MGAVRVWFLPPASRRLDKGLLSMPKPEQVLRKELSLPLGSLYGGLLPPSQHLLPRCTQNQTPPGLRGEAGAPGGHTGVGSGCLLPLIRSAQRTETLLRCRGAC